MRERQTKLECPHCDHWDSTVEQGWAHPAGYTRRRRCTACRKTFRTREFLIVQKPAISGSKGHLPTTS
jgi:transcriptional regulator NrdR family protein